MNLHNTPQQPILIRKRDWLALPDDQRKVLDDGHIQLVMSAGGRMVPAQVID